MIATRLLSAAKVELTVSKLIAGMSSNPRYDMLAAFHINRSAVFVLKAICANYSGVAPETEDISDLIDIVKDVTPDEWFHESGLATLRDCSSHLECATDFYLRGDNLDTFTAEERIAVYKLVDRVYTLCYSSFGDPLQGRC